jgi:branched-subunit amino acid transport protein
MAAVATVLAGFLTRSMMAAIFAGGASLFAGLWLFS